jgi:hypothetical protein
MRLGEYLQLAEISQTRFAAQIGVRQATISRYISGADSNPKCNRAA